MRTIASAALLICAMAVSFNDAHADGRLRTSYDNDTPPWSGFYIGGQVDGGWGSFDSSGSGDDVTGFVGGGHAGVSLRDGSFVFGIEGDFSGSTIETSASAFFVTATAGTSWLASLRGRAGFTADNILVYGTAGLALAQADVSVSALGYSAESSKTMTGFVFGGGAELPLGRGVTGRIEALHYQFSDQEIELVGLRLPFDASFTVVRGDVSFYID